MENMSESKITSSAFHDFLFPWLILSFFFSKFHLFKSLSAKLHIFKFKKGDFKLK